MKVTPTTSLRPGNPAYHRDSLGAIDEAIAGLGGLKEQWPRFVLYNWNRKAKTQGGREGEPYRYYAHWDQIYSKSIEEVNLNVRLNGKTSAKFSLAHKIPHLAARYFHYNFTKDESVRSLKFTQPYWGGQESRAKVQAIVKIRGQEWKEAEDWTTIREKKLCRDKPNEDFEELVIVISNSEFNDRTHILTDINSSGGPPTELTVSAIGCSPWLGSVKFSSTNNVTQPGTEIVITETATADNVVFDLVDEGAYKATAGLVTWNHSGSARLGFGALNCSGQASGTFLVSDGDSALTVFGDDTSTSPLLYSGLGELSFAQGGFEPILYPCAEGGSFPAPSQYRFRRWFITNAHISGAREEVVTDAEGNLVMKGESREGPDTWQWEFKQSKKGR